MIDPWIEPGATWTVELSRPSSEGKFAAVSIDLCFALFADHRIQGEAVPEIETIYWSRRARAIEAERALGLLAEADSRSRQSIAQVLRQLAEPKPIENSDDRERSRERQGYRRVAEQLTLDEDTSLEIARSRLSFLRDLATRPLERAVAALPPEMKPAREPGELGS